MQPVECTYVNRITLKHQVPRTLHVLGSLNPGGVEVWLMNLLRSGSSERFKLDVCLTTSSQSKGLFDDEFIRRGGRIVRCPVKGNAVAFCREFSALLRSGNYDVVHSHVHHFSGLIVLLATLNRVPIRVVHSHNDVHGKHGLRRAVYLKSMKALVNRYSTAGFACSDLAARALYGDNWASDSRWKVMPYGIDTRQFKRPVNTKDARKRLGIEENERVYGHVGMFTSQKNHMFLLEIAAKVIERDCRSRFLLIGDGPLRPQVESRIRELALSGRVTLLGARMDVPFLMQHAMDVFVFPSLFEGLGIVLLEAQAAGLPCIMSDVIPGIAVLVPEHCRRLSLEQPTHEWVAACLEASKTVGHDDVLLRIAQSPMSLESNIETMASVYSR